MEIGVPYFFHFESIREVQHFFPKLNADEAASFLVSDEDLRFAVAREVILHGVHVNYLEVGKRIVYTGFALHWFIQAFIYLLVNEWCFVRAPVLCDTLACMRSLMEYVIGVDSWREAARTRKQHKISMARFDRRLLALSG